MSAEFFSSLFGWFGLFRVNADPAGTGPKNG
jgi:hypothetical protein